MSLTPGFLDELRSRTSIAQVAGRKVTWDQRKSNPGKGDWWAPCPFHQEKTASFHVDDRKGFYYCFGCHAKGDAIGFVKDTENVGFMEAIEILAREAGMTMPARDPRAQEKADRRAVLADVMDAAARFFRMSLASNRGARARDYLDGRGLTDSTRDRFEVGFAPDDRGALLRHLVDKGVPEADLVDAGLVVKPDDGGAAYDRFRGRVMFPIRDARDRCIAFGGRALDPNARAKYLNSPETVLFDKGRSLYNLGPAREAAGKVGSLIVAEGYMDVIALAQAGFDHAVAPLGTAITEDQLQMLWRINGEPIIALDGDKAGLRAAYRLIDLSLTLLEPGRSLRFVILPEGQDPDDLLKASGPAAMQKLLNTAQPMVRLLWQRETEGRIFDSPERRATLDADLRAALKKIPDHSLRGHYGEAIREMRADLFAPRSAQMQGRERNGVRGGWQPKRAMRPTDGSKASLLAQSEGSPERLREALILAAAILAPHIAVEMEHDLDRLPITSSDLSKIRDEILTTLANEIPTDKPSEWLRERLAEKLGEDPLAHLLKIPAIGQHPIVGRRRPNLENVARTFREEIVKVSLVNGAVEELLEAEQDIQTSADERLTYRVVQATQTRDSAIMGSELDEGSSEDADRQRWLELQKQIEEEQKSKKKG